MAKTKNNMLAGKTIAAISTPPGKGGVAVIRISGDDALDIAKKIFRPRGNKSLDSVTPRTQIYGDILYSGEQIDDGLLTYFPLPNSYTGEDIIEISCHGGVLVTQSVLESAFVAGAVPAERGEFTKRAFVNGKLSLTETEAISMLLEAESHAQIMLSREKSRSRLKDATEKIRSEIVSILSSVFARIDYPDEDLGEMTKNEVLSSIEAVKCHVERLISTYKTGRAVTLGVPTVICGKPNVGKSTLYNLIVGENAAIVTDVPGTTRDVLEKNVPLGNVLLKLYDTAGIRGGEVDTVEAIGISRSMEKIESAELILALFDSFDFNEEDEKILDAIAKSVAVKIAIITKSGENANKTSQINLTSSDCKDKFAKCNFEKIIEISAKERKDEAIELLVEAVNTLFCDEKITIGEDAVISSARQYAALVRAAEFLSTASDAIKLGLPEDAVSSDVELALGAISELDGRAVSEEVVGDIFAKFCVGK